MELASERRRYHAMGGGLYLRADVVWLLIAVGLALAATLLALVIMRTGHASTLFTAAVYARVAVLGAQGVLQMILVQLVRSLAGTIAIWLPFLLLEVAAHEAGHLLAGRLVGFRFIFCTIGPFKLSSTQGGLR